MFFKLQIIYHYLKNRWTKAALYNAEKLKQLQQKRLQNWRKNLSNSPFYQQYQYLPLSQIPISNKAIFMDNFDAINTKNISKEEAFAIALKAEQTRDFSPEINGITVGLSSGTSGNRGIFLASEKERAMWTANVFSKVIGWSWKKRKVAFFLRANSNLYESINSRFISFSFFDIQQPMKQHVENIALLNPDIIVGQPSVLKALLQHCQAQKIKLKPTKVISVAEVLTPEDKQLFTDYFQQTIHQVYQCTEGFLAATCEEGNLHFNENVLLIEKKYLDETQTRFHPIITDLCRETQPIVRYELNDIIHEGQACQCGRKTMTIAQIEGRSDDVFYLKNKHGNLVQIFPDFIRRAVVFASEQVEEYVVIQENENTISLFVEAKIGTAKNKVTKQVIIALQNLFAKYKVLNLAISVLDSYSPPKGGKLRRVFRR